MFRRDHHIRVASVLQALNADILDQHNCIFGGGTAIALSHDEYRESIDIDLLISDRAGYQALRHLLTEKGLTALTRPGMTLTLARGLRADQYGLRTMLQVSDVQIKFEIILEGRIQFEKPNPKDKICGVSILTKVDMASTKLLANSDRWSDDSVFSRDLIDLAMLTLPTSTSTRALEKATAAYGDSINRDLSKAIQYLSKRTGRLEACMDSLKMDGVPRALLWNRIRTLKKLT